MGSEEGLWFVCLFYDRNSRRLNWKWFYGEARNRTCDPWFTRHRFIPYTTAASLATGNLLRDTLENSEDPDEMPQNAATTIVGETGNIDMVL